MQAMQTMQVMQAMQKDFNKDNLTDIFKFSNKHNGFP